MVDLLEKLKDMCDIVVIDGRLSIREDDDVKIVANTITKFNEIEFFIRGSFCTHWHGTMQH